MPGVTADELRVVIRAEIDDALKKYGKFSDRIDDTTKRLERQSQAWKKAGASMTRYFTLPIAAAGVATVKFAADIEKQRVAFGVLIGDVEAGAKHFEDLKQFSASTPLQLDDLADASATLQAFGTEAEGVIDELRMIGDVARGDATRLGLLSDAYGKLQAKGRATLEELNRFTENGVPLMAELARQAGVTTERLFEMVSQGEIRFEDVREALVALTSEGGQFYRMLELMAETTAGKLSTAIDNAKLSLADFGAELLPAVNEGLDQVTDLAKRFGELDGSTKRWILTLAGLTAATGPAIKGFMGLHTAMGFLKAHPAILALSAITAGVIAVSTAVKNANDRKTAEFADNIATGLEDAVGRGEELADTITEITDNTGLTVDQVIELAEQHGIVTDEIRKQIELLRTEGEEAEYSVDQIRRQNDALRDLLGTAANSLGDMADIARNFSEHQDVSLDRIIAIAETLDNLTGTQKEQLRQLKEQHETIRENARLHDRSLTTADIMAEYLRQQAEAAEAARDASEERLENEEAINRAIEARQDLVEGEETKLNKALAKTEQLSGAWEAIADDANFDAALRKEVAEDIIRLYESLAVNYAKAVAVDGKAFAKADELKALAEAAREYLESLEEAGEETAVFDASTRALVRSHTTLQDLLDQERFSIGENNAMWRAYRDLQEEIEAARIEGNLEYLVLLEQVEEALEEILGLQRETNEEISEGALIVSAFVDSIESGLNAALDETDEIVESLARSFGDGSAVMEDFGSVAASVFESLADSASAALMASGNPWGILAAFGIQAVEGVIKSQITDYQSQYDYNDLIRDAEAELAEERIELIKETIAEEQKLRREAISDLKKEFDLEFEVLRDLWERNLISTEEFESQARGLQSNLASEKVELEEPTEAEKELAAIEAAEDALEDAKESKLSVLGGKALELQTELDALSDWDKFWGLRDENIRRELVALDERIAAVNAAQTIEEVSAARFGADFITSGPELLMVGDNPGGQEHVSVEPLSSPNVNGPSDGDTFVISGNTFVGVGGVDQLIEMIDERRSSLQSRGRVM